MNINREKVKKKINYKLRNSFDRYFVYVFKSNTAIYCTLKDMKNNKVIKSISSRNLYKDSYNCNVEKSKNTGVKMGEIINGLGIKEVVFNRNGYLYHGKVKALADGIRSVGIKI